MITDVLAERWLRGVIVDPRVASVPLEGAIDA
jgi:hypothetical protein